MGVGVEVGKGVEAGMAVKVAASTSAEGGRVAVRIKQMVSIIHATAAVSTPTTTLNVLPVDSVILISLRAHLEM